MRVVADVDCASNACSSGRNTLTSPLEGLRVPTTATTSNGQKSVSVANEIPVAAIKASSGEQQRPRAEPVGLKPEGEGERAGSEQRSGRDDADVDRGIAEREQVKRQQQADEAVTECSQPPGGKHPAQRAKLRARDACDARRR